MTYADVNGISLYYEEHGSGQPLILLHGGLAAGSTYAQIRPALAAGRRVILVDLQAHGHTADVDRPLRYETLADDIAGLIGHLGLDQADVMGYSFGGATALRTAIQHPALVRRLVVVAVPFRRDGWYPESLTGMDQMGSHLSDMLKQGPLYELYASAAPRVEDWPVLLDKTGDLLRRDYDWSADLERITAPAMLVYADADAVRPAHIVDFYARLGGGLRKDPGQHAAAHVTGRVEAEAETLGDVVAVQQGLVAAEPGESLRIGRPGRVVRPDVRAGGAHHRGQDPSPGDRELEHLGGRGTLLGGGDGPDVAPGGLDRELPGVGQQAVPDVLGGVPAVPFQGARAHRPVPVGDGQQPAHDAGDHAVEVIGGDGHGSSSLRP